MRPSHSTRFRHGAQNKVVTVIAAVFPRSAVAIEISNHGAFEPTNV
jgi:hypothetical protein